VAETSDKDSDFTFYLPKEKNRVSFFNETHLYDRDASAKASTEVKTTDAEKQALMTFRDLKVGDRVSIGYDAGVVYNNAHAIVKVREASADAVKPVKASLKSETADPSAAPNTSVVDTATRKANDATKLDAETENARQIRKALVADETLSVKAKNVVIVQENGTFTLKGFADSAVEKEKVEKTAADVVGKERVVNQIEIAK
jgi:hyperosmotically inducible periplasmic protein